MIRLLRIADLVLTKAQLGDMKSNPIQGRWIRRSS